MPSLEDLLTDFQIGLIPAIKSKMSERVYATLEDMVEQAKLIKEDIPNQQTKKLALVW